MSTLTIEERIKVHAPPKRVWKFLLDPARVAACLPGAKLDGTEGEDTFLGTMKVKVGPVTMEIKGKATMSHIDPVARKVTLTGTGNDKAGGGSARMDMKSEIVALDDGGSEILVMAEVHLAGKLVRFGRGMMEGISKQLFKQFAERVHGALDDDDDEEDENEPVGTPEGGQSADDDGAQAPAAATNEEKAPEPEKAPAEEAPTEKAPTEKAPAEEAPAEKAPAEKTPEDKASVEEAPTEKTPDDKAPTEKAPAEGASAAKAEEEAAEEKAPAPKDEKQAAPKKAPSAAEKEAKTASKSLAPAKKKNLAKRTAPPVDDAPLDAGSLVWAAIWAWFRGLFGRIFGGKKE